MQEFIDACNSGCVTYGIDMSMAFGCNASYANVTALCKTDCDLHFDDYMLESCNYGCEHGNKTRPDALNVDSCSNYCIGLFHYLDIHDLDFPVSSSNRLYILASDTRFSEYKPMVSIRKTVKFTQNFSL